MLLVFLAIAVLTVLALLLAGRQGLPEAVVDLRPEVSAEDPRFDVVLRGYRMDEVDAALDRLRQENAQLRQERPQTPNA